MVTMVLFMVFCVDDSHAISRKMRRRKKLIAATKALLLPYLKANIAKGGKVIYSAPTIKFEDEFYIG